MARADDHLPLWTPLSLLALSVAAGVAWTTLSARHGSVARAAEPRFIASAARTAPTWGHPKLRRFHAPVARGLTVYDEKNGP